MVREALHRHTVCGPFTPGSSPQHHVEEVLVSDVEEVLASDGGSVTSGRLKHFLSSAAD